MIPSHPIIFISAVGKGLRRARDVVAMDSPAMGTNPSGTTAGPKARQHLL